jgi:hypothetical protein
MSEQVSGTHGPREDDELKREFRTELQAHELPDEGEPEATWVAGRPGGTTPGEDWETIDLRSDLARHLDRTAFPATRAHLLEALAAHQADEPLLDLVSSLPEGATFANLSEVLRALGLHTEERPT